MFEIDLSLPKMLEKLQAFKRIQDDMLGSEQIEYLGNLISRLDSANELLSTFDRKFNPKKVFEAAMDIASNQKFWTELDPGHYLNLDHKRHKAHIEWMGIAEEESDLVKKHDALKLLCTSKTKTLSSLTKATITITALKKFTNAEFEFADEFARRFADLDQAWGRFRYAIKKQEKLTSTGKTLSIRVGVNDIKAIGHSIQQMEAFVGMLKRHNIVSDWRKDIKKEDVNGKQVLVGTFSFDPNFLYEDQKLQFVEGLWFEAYTFKSMRETLDRQEIEYELFSEVSYAAKEHEKGRLENEYFGEFDILARVHNTLLMVECKSGHVPDKLYEKIVKNQRILNATLTLMGLASHESILIFSPLKPPRKIRPDQEPKYAETAKNLRRLHEEGFLVFEPHKFPAAMKYFSENKDFLDEHRAFVLDGEDETDV